MTRGILLKIQCFLVMNSLFSFALTFQHEFRPLFTCRGDLVIRMVS